MSRNKNLFLFAGYSDNGAINDAMVYYISKLSQYGDVIVYMDCDLPKTETNKLTPFTIAAIAKRHGEYDFGSYKYAYEFAKKHNILKKYDFVYLVNDSVFGPMIDIKNTIKNIESATTDATGLVVAKHRTHSYMESWFIRLNKNIFMTKWFDDFIMSVTHQEYKYLITIKYEHGLTNLIQNNKCSWSGIYTIRGRKTYNNPKYLFNHGCPFIKKASFTRHNGTTGLQIKYILKHSDPDAKNIIIKTAKQIYGEKYMNKFLTNNPLKIFYRGITYAITKLKKQ